MNTLKQLKPYLIVLTLTYISIAFINKEINPFLWGTYIRFFLVIIFLAISGIIYAAKEIEM